MQSVIWGVDVIQLSVRFPPVARLWEMQISQAYRVWIEFERDNDNTGEGNSKAKNINKSIITWRSPKINIWSFIVKIKGPKDQSLVL